MLFPIKGPSRVERCRDRKVGARELGGAVALGTGGVTGPSLLGVREGRGTDRVGARQLSVPGQSW